MPSSTAASTSFPVHAYLTSPTPPQPTHIPITFQKTQRRYAQRPVNHFPWKDFNLKMSGQGYVVGSDWAMTTFDDRTNDQFFDSKRLQTIDEGTEVRYFFPYDPLNYTSDLDALNMVDEVRRLDLHPKDNMVKRMFYGTKDCLVYAGYRIRMFCCRLLCI